MTFQLDDIMLKGLATRIKVGQTFKLRHDKRPDGSNCSVGKAPALSVTRVLTGWKYYCHRCHMFGHVSDEKNSPAATSDKIKALQAAKNEVKCKAVENISIPADTIPITTESGVPWNAKRWLFDAMITEKDMEKYKIGWSAQYNRVIIPFYQTGNGSLIGWVGREVLCKTKQERTKNGISKYLTQKKKGIPRLLYTLKGTIPNRVVVVEDILSAIRVHIATGYTVVALLTTYIDDQLILSYADYKMYIWLDADARKKSLRAVNRSGQFGVKTAHVYSSKDPKCYNDVFIRTQIK